jgi:hypothetical protein
MNTLRLPPLAVPIGMEMAEAVMETAADHKNCATAGLDSGTGTQGMVTASPTAVQPRTPPPLASHEWLKQVFFVPG